MTDATRTDSNLQSSQFSSEAVKRSSLSSSQLSQWTRFKTSKSDTPSKATASKRKQFADPSMSSVQEWLNQQLTVPPSFEEKERNDTRLMQFVNGWAFSTTSGAIIVMNALYI